MRHRRDFRIEHRHFVTQKFFVEKHFPGFRCTFHRNVLECVGEITPSEMCATYVIKMSYKNGGIPEVRIRSPLIPQSIWDRVHIYRNGTLCLYDHREQPWQWKDNLHEKIIPWTVEWLVFYELFLMCGKWLGPEALHGEAAKVPQGSVNGEKTT
jgi:hypothetical protein